MVEYTWNPVKARANLGKHQVGFTEAATVFEDPLGITVYDPDHSVDEERYLTVGASARGRLLIVAHAAEDDAIRIISARQLTRAERRDYEDEVRERQGR